MAKSKYLGTLRTVISSMTGDIMQTNEDLEVQSLARAVAMKGRDLIPRVYAIPEANIKVKCQATIKEGKVEMFGLGGSSDKEELVEITVEVPLRVLPPTADQLAIMSSTTEAEIKRMLIERGLRSGLIGSTFVADVSNDE